VTFLDRTPLPKPLVVNGRTVLEDGSPVVWFTFAGRWHDIGRFHLADGTFTGIYANILTPVRFVTPWQWETTDLCLDVWLEPDRTPRLLDADELAEAVRNGWIGPELRDRARAEAARILRLARRGDWPPEAVRRWTLDRVRREIAGTSDERRV
jgi:predicted RNA-binding protein associated with RNAse of E/G family